MFKKFFKEIYDLAKEIDNKNAVEVTQKCECCGAKMEGLSNQENLSCSYCGCSSKNESYKGLMSQHGNQQSFEEDIHKNIVIAEADDHIHARPFENYNSVYAYIEKSGLFYSGEIPGVSFSKVSLCNSYQECLDKLVNTFRQEKEKPFFKAPKQNLNAIRRGHPNAKIIRLS